jgi:protein-disulfide isomerase
MDHDGLTRLTVPVGPEDHVRGTLDAPVVMVEYGDFECAYCAMAYPTVKALEARYGERLCVVFRSFPLTQHRHAEDAAEAAEFAADHGKFWELHDALYERDRPLDDRFVAECVTRIGLDAEALRTALREQTYRPIVDEQKEGGEDSGIPGTPAFFLNGVLYEDEPTLENLASAIDWLLEHGTAT